MAQKYGGLDVVVNNLGAVANAPPPGPAPRLRAVGCRSRAQLAARTRWSTLACGSSLAALFFSLPVEWRTAAAAGLVLRVTRSADPIPCGRVHWVARCSVVRQCSCLHFAGSCAESACPMSLAGDPPSLMSASLGCGRFGHGRDDLGVFRVRNCVEARRAKFGREGRPSRRRVKRSPMRQLRHAMGSLRVLPPGPPSGILQTPRHRKRDG
jgi:hypothetical protein